jgi:hypothetical protein
MNKTIRNLLLTFLIGMLFISSAVAYENTDYNNVNKDYYIPNYTPELNHKIDWNYVYFNWDKAENEQFRYYKFVYSEKNLNPVYPDNKTFFIWDNVSKNSYKAKKLNWYYSICHVYKWFYEESEKTKYKACSKWIKISWAIDYKSEKKEYNKSEKKEYNKSEKKEYNKNEDKNENYNTSSVNTEIKKKLNVFVNSFKIKLDKKYSEENNSKKVIIIDSVIKNLYSLKSKKQKYSSIVDYLIIQLKELKEDYDEDPISEIENIFDFD